MPVRLFSNDPTSPVTTCWVRVEAGLPVLRTEPAEVDFGEVAVGTSPRQRVSLLRPDGTPWPAAAAVAVESAQRLVHAEITHAGEKTSERLELSVRPRSARALGHFADTLTLRPTGSQRSIQVPVRWVVVPLLVVSPSLLYYGDVDPRAAPVMRSAVLRRTDGKPLGRLVKTEAPAGIRVEDSSKPGGPSAAATRRLRVTYHPRGLSQDVKEGVVSLWLEGAATPLTVRVMILLHKDAAPPRR